MSTRLVPDWIDGFMEYTSNSEPPSSFKLWAALSVLSAALQRKCYLEWGPITFYPNIYVVLVAPSGRARKGTAMSFAEDFISDINVNLAAEAITREALIRALSDTTDNIQIAPGQLEFHSSLTVFAPELTVFLGYNNPQLMSDMTDWYDCRKKWTYRTKNMGTDEILGVYVSLFGATTPDLIRSALPLDAIGGGLTSRIIFVYEPNKGKVIPDPFLTDNELAMREKLKADLDRNHCLRGTFNVTKSFVELWTEWYLAQDNNPPFEDHRFAGYIERRPNHAMKISMLCNVSRSDKMILSDIDLQRAIDILTFTEQKMQQTFSGVGKAKDADIVTRVMTEIASRGEILQSKLQTMFYFDADKRTMEGVIDTLRAMKFIKTIREGSDTNLIYMEETDAPAEQGCPSESVQTNRPGTTTVNTGNE